MRSTTLAHFGTNSLEEDRKDASENYISNSNASMQACAMDKVGAGAAKLYNTTSPRGSKHEQEMYALKNVITNKQPAKEDSSDLNLKVPKFDIEMFDE